MIPAIGFMIGCYILVRMVSFITRVEEREESIIVKVLAAVTMLITGLCLWVLWGNASTPLPTP